MTEKRLNNDIRRRDKTIDDWVDKAIDVNPYARDVIFRFVCHVVAKQNEDIRRSIDLKYQKRGR